VYKKNDGIGEDNILQNQFTAYLIRAVRNRKIQCFQQRAKLNNLETILETQASFFWPLPDDEPTDRLPVIDLLENTQLQKALHRKKERELYILFARTLHEKPFDEIAHELGLKVKTATSIYYRLIEKLKAELRGDD